MKCKKLLKKREWTELEAMSVIGLLSGGFYKYVKSEGYCISNGVLMLDKKKVIQWAIDNKKDIPAPFYKYYVQEILPENEKNKPITNAEVIILKGLVKLRRYNFKITYYNRKEYLETVKGLIKITGFDITTPQKTAEALEVALNEISHLHFKVYKIKHLLDIRFTQDDYKDYISMVFYKRKWGELPPNDTFYSSNKSWILFIKFLISRQGFYININKPIKSKIDRVSKSTLYKLLQEINISNFS